GTSSGDTFSSSTVSAGLLTVASAGSNGMSSTTYLSGNYLLLGAGTSTLRATFDGTSGGGGAFYVAQNGSVSTSGTINLTSSDATVAGFGKLTIKSVTPSSGGLASAATTFLVDDSIGSLGSGIGTVAAFRFATGTGSGQAGVNTFLSISASTSTASSNGFSTTTFMSHVNSGVGAGAFVFDTKNALVVTSGTVLMSIRNAGTKAFSFMSDGAFYATGTVNANTAVSSVGDFAENVSIVSGESVEPGDVMIADPGSINKFKKSFESFAKGVSGVISDTGAFVIGAGGENRATMGLTGLVRTKVTTENGQIAVGDYLVTASKAGYAMKYDQESGESAGLVGMALEPLTSGEGRIIVMINKGYVSGAVAAKATTLSVAADAKGNLVQTGNLDMAGQSIINIAGLKSKNGTWSIDSSGNLVAKNIKADKVQTKELVIEKDQQDNKSTVGSATIKNGQTYIDIANDGVKSTSKVFVTFRGNPNSFWWISNQQDGKFTVSLSSPAAQDITFDYWLVNTTDASSSDTASNESADTDVVQQNAPVNVTSPVAPAVTEEKKSEPTASDAKDSAETKTEEGKKSDAEAQKPSNDESTVEKIEAPASPDDAGN
ncbi:MAG: hypothetical protein HY981_01980, partial [Candidatus Magasanikbacteria bacterium]|nr:hypothetical protein [Candidatus Magasanikbacteria bacterium]